MNDQFLSDFQEPPRPEFAEALYQRINTPMKPSSVPLRRLTLGFTLLALLVALTLTFSPAARAYAQGLIFQIGRLFISHEPTSAEQFETKINSGTPTVTPVSSPAPLEWQAPPLLSPDEATTQAGFAASEITAVPETFNLVARFVTFPDANNPYTRVTTTYTSGETNLVFSQALYEPGASQTLPVGESPVSEVIVQGVKGLWIEKLRLATYVDENNQVAPQYANLLVWEKDGFEYRLQFTPGLSLDEMLAIANSVKP